MSFRKRVWSFLRRNMSLCHETFYPLAPEFVRLYHKTRICKKNTFCTYGAFGRYSPSTLLSFISNFSYWFEIVSPCFVTRYNVRKLSLIEFRKHFEQSLSGSVNVCCISIWLCPLFKEFDKTKSEVKSEILWHYKLKVVFFFICINDSSTCKPWCHEAFVPISSPTPIKYYEFVEYTLVSLSCILCNNLYLQKVSKMLLTVVE